MARKERYPGKRSEYGGGDGSPQRFPDGSSKDLASLGTGQSVSERARLLRQAGMNDFDPSVPDELGLVASGIAPSEMTEAQKLAYEIDLERTEKRRVERKRLMDATNDYINEPEQYQGEETS